ncbi:hypothetical protein J4226_05685 [Candidatus Pacearchaeota archaeon]|nr:hypothetical protein [Candidatus Pacearchaeota archaeon]
MMKKNEIIIGVSLIFLEVSLLLALFTFIPNNVIAGIGSPSTIVITNLTIGNTYPDIINVSINDDAASIALTPNATTKVSCVAVIREYNGDADVTLANATFYDSVASSPGDANDNNDHYSNSSCELIADTSGFNGYADDPYHSLANCTFQVQYYANPEDWVCEVTAIDTMDWTSNLTDDITVSPLLALGLPDVIEYGTVNATFVSNENITNITNFGNVQINLTLEGYGTTQGDGIAMNCSLGNIGYIPIEFEKYNLTASTTGPLSLSAFETNYINLTSAAVTKRFELNYRTDDVVNDAIKESYWRIYVPRGVAGTCNGSIIFGATQASGN